MTVAIIYQVFLSSLRQGDRMDREAMKCQVLTVSNHSCESLTLEGNTLECTVPTELQAAPAKELQVEVRRGHNKHGDYFLGTDVNLGSGRMNHYHTKFCFSE